MQKKLIKLRYVDTMSRNYKEEMLWRFLTEHYEIDEVSEPDYIICGGMGHEFTKYKDCVRIQIIGENIVPDFNMFDYAIGFDNLTFGDRYIRIPLFFFYDAFHKLPATNNIINNELAHRKFCSYVVSNAKNANPIRDNFFFKLCEYKKVDSAGRHLNNMGGAYLEDKLAFISEYKFNIAFENCSSDGYTTEKIMEPMAVNTIPIYWGNPSIESDFNKDSFIFVNDFNSIDECIEYIKKLDNNDDLYIQKLKQSWGNDTCRTKYNQQLTCFLDNIFSQGRESAKRVNFYGNQVVLRKRLFRFYEDESFVIKIKRNLRKFLKKIRA